MLFLIKNDNNRWTYLVTYSLQKKIKNRKQVKFLCIRVLFWIVWSTWIYNSANTFKTDISQVMDLIFLPYRFIDRLYFRKADTSLWLKCNDTVWERYKLGLTRDARCMCLNHESRQTLTDCILKKKEKKKEVKPRYRIHELSRKKHFCILSH